MFVSRVGDLRTARIFDGHCAALQDAHLDADTTAFQHAYLPGYYCADFSNRANTTIRDVDLDRLQVEPLVDGQTGNIRLSLFVESEDVHCLHAREAFFRYLDTDEPFASHPVPKPNRKRRLKLAFFARKRKWRWKYRRRWLARKQAESQYGALAPKVKFLGWWP